MGTIQRQASGWGNKVNRALFLLKKFADFLFSLIVVTRQRVGRYGIKFALRATNLSLFPQPKARKWGPPILLFYGYKGVFPRSKTAGAWSWLISISCRIWVEIHAYPAYVPISSWPALLLLLLLLLLLYFKFCWFRQRQLSLRTFVKLLTQFLICFGVASKWSSFVLFYIKDTENQKVYYRVW